jgi:hypothetical protein
MATTQARSPEQSAVEYPDGTVVRGPQDEIYIVAIRGLVPVPADVIQRDAEELGVSLPRDLG